MATSTITGTITDATGTPISGVTVIARLRPSGFRTSDYAELTDKTTTTNGSGVWSLVIERNSNITPAGTYYEIEEQIPAASGGPHTWAINADASGTLFARLLAAPPTVPSASYITQTIGDARYRLAPAAVDAVRYVSTIGDDSSDGLTSPKLTIQAGIDALPAGGGLVLVADGTYLVSTALQLRSNVTVAAVHPRAVTVKASTKIGTNAWLGMVLIRDSVAGVAVQSNIELNGLILDANNQTDTPCLTAQGFSNVRLVNCQLTGAATTAVANALVLGGNTVSPTGPASDQILLRDCEIGPSHNHGLLLGGGNSTADVAVLTNVTIEDCYVHNNDGDGVCNYTTNARTISGVRVAGCHFKTNAITAVGGGSGHLNDLSRTGWVDTEVTGCYFDAAGSNSCGGFSDHKGRNIKVHHNTFRIANNVIWPIALGDSNGLATTARTRWCWVEDNHFDGGNSWDFDSCTDVFVRRNVFYRMYGRPLGAFGNHLRTVVEDNSFIENGQGGVALATYEKAAVSCGAGFVFRRNIFRDDQGTPTQLAGVYEVDGGTDTGPLVYEDNDFTTMATPVHESASYATHEYRRNRGINPIGITAGVSAGASPYTYTNADKCDELLYIVGGTVSAITKSGVGWLTSSPAQVFLAPGESVIITHTGAPTLYRDRR